MKPCGNIIHWLHLFYFHHSPQRLINLKNAPHTYVYSIISDFKHILAFIACVVLTHTDE